MTKPAFRPRKRSTTSHLKWPAETELVGLVLDLCPVNADYLYPQYTIGLHAWFLDQVRQLDPELSAYLHDGESEKPFAISGLDGELLSRSRGFQLQADQTYRWYVTALSAQVVDWLALWVKKLPEQIDLRNAPLKISSCAIAHPPKTYAQLLEARGPGTANQANIRASGSTVTLSFLTPTSFRRKGYHFPLPVPTNVFHSYLRRWNNFSERPVDQEKFLEWVDEAVIIHRHQLESAKVAGGKKGMVTGFTGAVEFGLSPSGRKRPEFEQLFYGLAQLAPYCGTGHKTTFGLGQTRLGWLAAEAQLVTATPQVSVETLLAQRIAELTEIFMSQQKRTGGDRALHVCETRATILARRELGESLQAIAADMEIPYETVKTYAKLARRSLRSKE